MNPEDIKMVTIKISLPQKAVKRLDELCEIEGRTRSDAARTYFPQAIDAKLKEHYIIELGHAQLSGGNTASA